MSTDKNIASGTGQTPSTGLAPDIERELAYLAAIIESSDDAIISKSLDGIITSWNKTAERIFGYTAAEMIGMPILTIIPEDRRDEEPAIIERLKKGERVDHFETQRITKDKRLVDISLTISPIRDSKGRIIGASKIARDITHQKEDERALRESETRMRLMMAYTRLGTWEFYPVSGQLTWSEECRNIYDVPDSVPIDFNLFSELVHPDDAAMVQGAVANALDPSGDGDYDLEFRILRYTDKQPRWIRSQGKVFFEEGKAFSFIGTVLDISEHKERERKMKESIELFTVMADNVPAMIWMSGNDKFSDFFNKTWLAFTGRTIEQEKGEGWVENVHPEDAEKCRTEYQNALKAKKGFYIEYRLRRYDGEYRWIADNAVPRYDPDGRFAGFISACTDIDDQKRLEKRKDDFIQMASHELKTPITSIKGYVQLLLAMLGEISEDKLHSSIPVIRQSLGTVSRQVSKLTRLISELLDLSRIESGKLEMHSTDFELASVIQEAVSEVQYTTSRHAISFQNDFTGTVYGDRDRIAQLLTNLLTNAVKYSPEGGKVEVSVKKAGTNAMVIVKDYGIGIDKKDQQKIFERFYRVEGRSEQTYPGFGIGLFIVSEILGRHHGTISVESEKGKGSSFIVTLPLHTA